MSHNIILRILCGICWLSSVSYAQDFVITSDVLILAYGVDFSNSSSPGYEEFKADIERGLTDKGQAWDITKIGLRVSGEDFQGVKFELPPDSALASEFLKKFMVEGFEIKKTTVYPTNVQCTDKTGKPQELKTGLSACGIRHKIDPCPQLSCYVADNKPVCGVSSGGSESSGSEKEIDSETGRFVVLGYGAAFVAFLIVFLIVYCYKKGCANRRKQIKNEEEDAERHNVSDTPIIPNHIYNKSRRY